MIRGLLLATFFVLGCAHYMTIHEVCSDPETAVRFKDYNQCYAEVTKQREEEAVQDAAFAAQMQSYTSQIGCTGAQVQMGMCGNQRQGGGRVDLNCMDNCQSLNYAYQYCKSRCTY